MISAFGPSPSADYSQNILVMKIAFPELQRSAILAGTLPDAVASPAQRILIDSDNVTVANDLQGLLVTVIQQKNVSHMLVKKLQGNPPTYVLHRVPASKVTLREPIGRIGWHIHQRFVSRCRSPDYPDLPTSQVDSYTLPLQPSR